jgi:hypothetical protein
MKIKDPFAVAKMLNPNVDDVIERKKLKQKDQRPQISRQFYCHGCNTWQACENDFKPYDCPDCGKSRWGD